MNAAANDRLLAAEVNTARSSVVISLTTLAGTALGGLFAVSVALIVGAGPETDGFFAAYSAYTVFIVFGTSMRVALVPQLGATEDPVRFRANAADRISRILPIVALVCVLLAALAPLIGMLLTLEAPSRTRSVATASIVLLGLAAFFQVWAAVTAAMLVGARRFVATSLFSVLSLFVSVVLSIALIYAWGIIGASVGMAIGAAVFALAQVFYLKTFEFSALPRLTSIRERESWTVVGRMASAAALPIVMQLYLTIALATVSSEAGAATAYTYAYLTLTVIAGATIGTIGMVTMPLAVDALHQHGVGAAIPFLRDAGSAAFFLFWPLALAYSLFGYPVVEAVFAGSFDASTLQLFWDGSRVFLIVGVAWAFGLPFTTFALARHQYARVAAISVVQLPVHLLAVQIASGSSPLTVVAVHTATGIFLVASLSFALLGWNAVRALGAMFAASWPCVAIGMVFVALRLVVGDPETVVVSIGCIVGGGLLYMAIAFKATPNLGGRMVKQLLGKGELA